MKVHVYEKAWMAAAIVLLVVFVGAVVLTAAAHGIQPPSHVETIDPLTARTDARFATLGTSDSGGGVRVVALAQMWSFLPGEIRVPAGRPVTFRLTSPDLIHGFEVVGTNVNTMIVPGYISEITTTFQRPGDYLIVCNEYCGAGHHVMSGKLVVEASR